MFFSSSSDQHPSDSEPTAVKRNIKQGEDYLIRLVVVYTCSNREKQLLSLTQSLYGIIYLKVMKLFFLWNVSLEMQLLCELVGQN